MYVINVRHDGSQLPRDVCYHSDNSVYCKYPVRQAFFHGYAMPSLCVCVCVCVCVYRRTVISTHVYTVNVVVEWRQLAAICVNVYVQVRV